MKPNLVRTSRSSRGQPRGRGGRGPQGPPLTPPPDLSSQRWCSLTSSGQKKSLTSAGPAHP